MHTFRYEKGHTAGATMTVGELREHLASFPADMPVMATWEGVRAFIQPEAMTTENVDKGCMEDSRRCLVIDVEAY